ncbi:MAG: FKBP-type peptidyl-prolyl cis-trans isomerase [Nitrospiraceae bacterium]|nr:MAG: FKBP-type peptidyl-prolyl cis-trans isomerase [Nitrospiraceae bacterium]
MRFFIAVLGILFLANMVHAGETVLKTQRDKVSYGIGMDIGNGLKSQSIDVDPDILSKGIKDVLSGSKTMMTDEEFRETMTNFQNELRAKQMERMKEIAEKNKKDGEAFLEGNKKKEGVVTLPSGLQYKVIKEGTGEKPEATDMVTADYRGTLVDGTEFDSSARHGQPMTFKVNGVIPGWTEALQLMKVGSKWQLFIPPTLAYGERGAGKDIGPNSTLIFDVELISIADEEPAAQRGHGH